MSELARLVVRLAVESAAFVRGMKDASKESKSFVEGFKKTATEMQSQVQMAQNTMQEFARAVQEGFEALEEGAQINQLQESFDRTTVSIAELREAARGTVDDVSLMSQSMTLLAGTSGELEAELAASLPGLLEVAKASNKLNPELGETSHLFQSLAEGVKRGSRLMIDNTGIVFGEAEAYEAYARKVGVAADALSEQQKKIALLHMTLERGQTLIEQNAGSIESQADAYAVIRTEIENMGDTFKSVAADKMAPFAEWLAEIISTFNEANEAIEDADLLVAALSGDYKTLYQEMFLYGREQAEAERAQRELNFEQQRGQYVVSEVSGVWDSLGESTREATEATISAIPAFTRSFDAIENMGGELQQLRDASEQMDFTKWSVDADFTEQLETSREQLSGLYTEAGNLRGQIAELEGASWLSAAQTQQLEDLRGQLDDVESEIADVTQGLKDMAAQFVLGLIEMRISADGEISQIESQMYTAYAEQMGLIDETAAQMSNDVMSIFADMDAGVIGQREAMLRLYSITRDTVEEYDALGSTGQQSLSEIVASGQATIEKLQEIGISAQTAQDIIDRMHGKDLEFNVKWNAEPLRLPDGSTVESPTGDYAYAEGGFMPAGAVGIAGEAGPELLQATSQGVKITPLAKAPAMASAPSPMSFNGGSRGPTGGNVTNTFYIDGARDAREVAREIEQIWIRRGIMPRQRFM